MTRRRRLRAACALATSAAFYGQLLWSSMWPAVAFARVSPISSIARQIHKANMLVVLDTSGSMNGIPGGLFDYPKEVGVDCDNGTDCRLGVAGTCNATPADP